MTLCHPLPCAPRNVPVALQVGTHHLPTDLACFCVASPLMPTSQRAPCLRSATIMRRGCFGLLRCVAQRVAAAAAFCEAWRAAHNASSRSLPRSNCQHRICNSSWWSSILQLEWQLRMAVTLKWQSILNGSHSQMRMSSFKGSLDGSLIRDFKWQLAPSNNGAARSNGSF